MRSMTAEEFQDQKKKIENGCNIKDPQDVGVLERLCDTAYAMNECLKLTSEISVILFGFPMAAADENVRKESVLKNAVNANMITAGLLLDELRELAGRIGCE